MKTIDDWLDSIFSDKHPGYGQPLSRVSTYFRALGLDDALSPIIISITGTNGKGSTARLIEAIYLAEGLRVAVITSPHLINFCERLTLNGEPVDQFELVAAFNRVKSVIQDAKVNAFDFISLALLLCVKRFKPQILILEVGVGGRLDIINLFNASAVVVTTIGLDHAPLLGNTREAVAFEKAQLARAGHPLICGDEDPPQALLQTARETAATLYLMNSKNNGFAYKEQEDSWDWVGPHHTLSGLPKPPLKLQNAACALMCIASLADKVAVREGSICQGLRAVTLPGRFELVRRHCPIILDVAHNPQACHWLALQLRNVPVEGRTLLVFGMLASKNLTESLQPLLDVANSWYVAPLSGERESYAALQIQQELEALGEKNCYTSRRVSQALQCALSHAGCDDRIVVFGSFLAVAEAKQVLGD